MNDDQQSTPGDDDLGRQLRSGFEALAKAAGPPSALRDRADGSLPQRDHVRARRGLVAAAILIAFGLAAAAAIVRAGDDDPGQTLRAGGSPSSSDESPDPTAPRTKLPDPTDSAKLICPPALLDVGAIGGTPVLSSTTGANGGESAYELLWKQDGRTVRLSYPAPLLRLTIAMPQETVKLSDGRTVYLEGRSDMTAEVRDAGVLDCNGFWVQISGDGGRQTLLDVAEVVHIRAPEGTANVPDVIGLSQVDAQNTLARAGLIPSRPWAFGAGSQLVLAQKPAAGSTVDIGAEVSLTMATPATAPPPPPVDVDKLPTPTDPLVCPMGRLQVDDDFRSIPEVSFDTTIAWQEDGDFGGHQVQLTWPNRTGGGSVGLSPTDPGYENQSARQLTVLDRPALMHDGGDGQDLVYDTGLSGACRFLEIGVYGGPSIPERERRAEALANGKVTITSPPTAAPPIVTGLTIAVAADRLARAGFIPDWGEDRAINDEPTAVPTAIVTTQTLSAPGVVRLNL